MIIIKFITTENEETELKYTLKKEKKEKKRKKIDTLSAKSSLCQKFLIKYKTHTHNQSIQKNLTLYPFNLATQQRKKNDHEKI